jgi:hypothetical protein
MDGSTAQFVILWVCLHRRCWSVLGVYALDCVLFEHGVTMVIERGAVWCGGQRSAECGLYRGSGVAMVPVNVVRACGDAWADRDCMSVKTRTVPELVPAVGGLYGSTGDSESGVVTNGSMMCIMFGLNRGTTMSGKTNGAEQFSG